MCRIHTEVYKVGADALLIVGLVFNAFNLLPFLNWPFRHRFTTPVHLENAQVSHSVARIITQVLFYLFERCWFGRVKLSVDVQYLVENVDELHFVRPEILVHRLH